MFECDGKYRWWENKKRGGIASIWQCLLATFLLETPVPRWLILVLNKSVARSQISHCHETPMPRWLISQLLVDWCWNNWVGCRLYAMKYVWDDSLHRTTHLVLNNSQNSPNKVAHTFHRWESDLSAMGQKFWDLLSWHWLENSASNKQFGHSQFGAYFPYFSFSRGILIIHLQLYLLCSGNKWFRNSIKRVLLPSLFV